MEEMPEYQICEKCGKRGTPTMRRCWNCGALYPGFEEDHNISILEPIDIQSDEEEPESELLCDLEKMDLCRKIFAWDLLLKGEMVLSFCDCEKCTESLSSILAFIMECDPEDPEVKSEVEKIDRNKFRFDVSSFNMEV